MHTLHFCTLPTVQECKECTGVIPEFEMMTTEFFPGVPLYPLQWFTALRPISGVQSHPCCRARKLQPCGKFLSILGNFCSAFIRCTSAIGINSIALGLLNKSSRMVKDHAKNIPTEPKGATPLRPPVPTRAEPSLLGLCRVQPGEDRRSTPIRLLAKPYTPIVPQHKRACL